MILVEIRWAIADIVGNFGFEYKSAFAKKIEKSQDFLLLNLYGAGVNDTLEGEMINGNELL